jgi:SAM-dependent methyltransferase
MFDSGRASPGWYWTSYWKGGAGFSLSHGRPGYGSADVLQNRWVAIFAETPEGARVLDMATGAGQVAGWAAAAGRAFSITAVDLADIPPSRPDAPGVQFLGGVPLESLPFDDSSFDLIVSQYGYEYGDRQKTASEAARVLAPGGRGRLVLHHRDSVLSTDYDARAAVFRAALRDVDPVRLGRKVFELHAKPAPVAGLAEAEARFRASVEKSRARLAEGPAHAEARTYVDYLAALAAEPARFEPSDALAKLDQVEQLTNAWLLRYQAQVRAVLDASGIESVRHRLGRQGLEVAPAEPLVSETGALLAWSLAFEKPV